MNKKTIQHNTFKSPGTYLISKIDLGKIVEIQISFTQCTVEIKNPSQDEMSKIGF